MLSSRRVVDFERVWLLPWRGLVDWRKRARTMFTLLGNPPTSPILRGRRCPGTSTPTRRKTSHQPWPSLLTSSYHSPINHLDFLASLERRNSPNPPELQSNTLTYISALQSDPLMQNSLLPSRTDVDLQANSRPGL